LDLLKLDADRIGQLLLREAKHPAAMTQALAHMGIGWVLHIRSRLGKAVELVCQARKQTWGQSIGPGMKRTEPVSGEKGRSRRASLACHSSIFVPSGSRIQANFPVGSLLSSWPRIVTPLDFRDASKPSRSSTAKLIINSRLDGSKYFESFENGDHTVR